MTSPRVMTYGRTYPVPVEQAFDRLLPAPLSDVFRRRFGPLPPIARTEGDGSGWGEIGQRRTVVLAGPAGGMMRERLTAVERPHRFDYELAEIAGPLRPLLAHIDGSWSFVSVGTGSRITWTWTVQPASRAAAVTVPLLARLWRGYARRALDDLDRILLPERP